MLGCVVQNFHNETPYLSRTLRYNSLINYKLNSHINFMSKFITFFHSNHYAFLNIKPYIFQLYREVTRNHFMFYTLFNNPLLGSWLNNLTKSYYLNTLSYLVSTLSLSKNKLTKNSSHSNNLNYLVPFKVLSFNTGNKIHKRNILFLLNYITNMNSSFSNYWQTDLTFTLYPKWFFLLNCNDSYYFRIKRF